MNITDEDIRGIVDPNNGIEVVEIPLDTIKDEAEALAMDLVANLSVFYYNDTFIIFRF